MKTGILVLFQVAFYNLHSFAAQHINHHIRNEGFSPLLWLFLIILVITAGIVLYRFVSRTSSFNNSEESNNAVDIIKFRFAKGEISKKTYSDIHKIIRHDSNRDYIEKLKIRLAKGEITVSEFNEMSELLLEE